MVWVRASGRLRTAQADHLWGVLEAALCEAQGRAVIVDFARVSEMDSAIVSTVVSIARLARRWRRDLCLVLGRSGAVAQRSRWIALGQLVPIYQTADQAAASALHPTLAAPLNRHETEES
jgi:anti-anti-sigma regulatory factor